MRNTIAININRDATKLEIEDWEPASAFTTVLARDPLTGKPFTNEVTKLHMPNTRTGWEWRENGNKVSKMGKKNGNFDETASKSIDTISWVYQPCANSSWLGLYGTLLYGVIVFPIAIVSMYPITAIVIADLCQI